MTEPYMTNGPLPAFAEMFYGDQADAHAAEQVEAALHPRL